MSKLKTIEIHTEEVREIMGQIPGWIVRWGLSVIFGVFMVIVLGSYFFKYPETITAPIVITTINPPAELICKVSGKIQKLFSSDGQEVVSGSLIAVIENTTDFDDYLSLKDELALTNNENSWENAVLEHEDTLMLSLGDIQNSFETYKKNWNSFRNYLLAGFTDQKTELLQKQIEKKEEYIQILEQQKALQDIDFRLSKKRVVKDSAIFVKGGISEKEYETEKQLLLQKESALKGYEASLNNAASSVLTMKENLLELHLKKQSEISQYIIMLDESKQTLETSIRKWEELYMIVSPVAGKIAFSSFWSENQMVNAGDRLATVVPSAPTRIIGRTIIPRAGFGKVEVGQKVNIKLSGFPYMEFGMLTGYISSISMIPEKDGYVAEIELPQGMLTNYSEDLRFIHEMDGTADIITQQTRMISRFINPIKSMVKN